MATPRGSSPWRLRPSAVSRAEPIPTGAARHTSPRRFFPEGRVGADNDGLLPSLAAVNDGEEDLLPPVRTMDVAWPERGGQAIAVLIEDEERMVADGLEVTVVGRLLGSVSV